MEISELYNFYLQHPSVTTDSRKLQKGDIFFALSGTNHNGNEYILAALRQGASLCIGDDMSLPEDDRIVKVQDVLNCLQQLACRHRESFSIPFIGITGSNGKTTTKELVHAVLSKKYKCYTTAGNLNNHIGVPLTLLAIKNDAEIAIVEMGANHREEIKSYCAYTHPTHGLITNVGKAHLEGFGSEEGIRKGKGELFDYLAATDGTVFLNADYSYLSEMAKVFSKIVTYGCKEGTFRGEVIKDKEMLAFKMVGGADIPLIQTNLVGGYNLPNALAAVCIGKTFGVEDADIKIALEEYQPGNSRSQHLRKGDNVIILDAYNANPSSMKAAIENFAAMKGENKVLYLGAMKEMGDQCATEHQSLTQLLEEFDWKEVVLVGNEFKGVSGDYKYFEKTAEAHEWFKLQHYAHCNILIKGSRSMAMEKVIED